VWTWQAYDARDVGLRLILAFFSPSIGLVAVFLLRLGGGPEMFGTQSSGGRQLITQRS
jgi:hypothetical protein